MLVPVLCWRGVVVFFLADETEVVVGGHVAMVNSCEDTLP
jgi:hypothetical protein